MSRLNTILLLMYFVFAISLMYLEKRKKNMIDMVFYGLITIVTFLFISIVG